VPSEAQDLGRRFEEDFAKALGGKLTPASGAKWFARMDVEAGSCLWSLKATQLRTFPLSQRLVDEVVAATEGPGGSGAIPALAIRIGGPAYDLVVLRRDDFIRIVEERQKFVAESRASAKREQARVPILLREDANADYSDTAG
jgi:hypothetical protein